MKNYKFIILFLFLLPVLNITGCSKGDGEELVGQHRVPCQQPKYGHKLQRDKCGRLPKKEEDTKK